MRILIFQDRNQLKNTGGPTGYLYNIAEYLKKNPVDEILFLDSSRIHETILSQVISFIINGAMSVLKRWPCLQLFPLTISNFIWTKKFTKSTIDYLNTFDVIHIHSVPQIHSNFKRNKVRGKLILTSHCPEPVTDEMIGYLNIGTFMAKFPKLRKWLISKEVQVYDICDNIMFPVPQARESYENASPLYRKKFSSINDKFFYIPTALNDVQRIEDNHHVLDKYTIPQEALKLCYVGRHTGVKGFPFLKEVATQVWKTMPDTFFIIGGKEAPLKGLEDNRWIELGWVNTPSLLNEIDAFILPNKETYFDLILLEVMRQGVPVLLSKTGGNKWFEKANTDGLIFFEYGNHKDLENKIHIIHSLKVSHNLEKMGMKNATFLKNNLNMENYMNSYLQSLHKLVISH